MVLTLDLSAVLAVGALFATIAAFVLLATWRESGRPPYLAAWIGFGGCAALAFAIHAARGVLPEAVIVLVGTPLFITAWTCCLAGARRLRGGTTPVWVLALAPAVWYAACAFPAFRADIMLRGGLGALIFGALTGGAALEVLRLPRGSPLRRGALPLGLLSLFLAVIVLVRGLRFFLGATVEFGGLIYLFGIMLTLVVAFAGLALANIQAAEREAARATDALRREAAALEAGRAEVLRLHNGLPAILFCRAVAADGSHRLLYRGGDLEHVTGWPAAVLQQHADLDALAGIGAPPLPEFLARVLREETVTVDWQMRRPDGAMHWMRTYARRLSGDPAGGGEVVGTILNVQAEYEAAAAAAAAQAREAVALQEGRDQVARLHAGLPTVPFHRVLAPDGTSRLIYRGGNVEAVTGWPAEVVADPARLAPLVEGGLALFAAFEARVLEEGSAVLDWRLQGPDGAMLWMRSRARRVALHPDGSGEVIGFLLDVSAEYAARAAETAAQAREAALREEHLAQLGRLHAGLPALLFHREVAPDGTSRLLYRGGDLETVLGWPEAALRDLPSLDTLDAEPGPGIDDVMRAVLASGSHVNDWRMRRADGSVRWMRQKQRVLGRRPDGMAEVVGTVQDVEDEYRRAEEARAAAEREAALREEHLAQLHRLHAGLPAVLFHREVAPDGTSRLLYRGGNLEAVLGWSEAALRDQPDLMHLGEGGGPSLEEMMRHVLAEGHHVIDWPMQQGDGSLRWMRQQIRLLARRPDGTAEVVGTIHDVEDEYRRAEEARAAAAREAALREANLAQLHRLHAGMPVIVFHRDCQPDRSTRLIYRGGDHLAVTGWPEERFGLSPFTEIYAPGTPPFEDFIRRVLQDGQATLDWQAMQPDGSFRWMRNFGRRLTRREDGGGEVVGYVIDVQAEREASAQAAELERTLGYAPIIVHRLRVTADGGYARTYLGRGAELVLGVPFAELAAVGSLVPRFAPEHQADAPDKIRRLLCDGQVVEEVRVRHADGRWLRMHETLAVVERLPDGGAEVIGIMLDVTAQRAAEEAAAALDRTLAVTPAVVYRARAGADGGFARTYLSRGVETLTGWPLAHFEGHPGTLRDIMEYESEAQREAMRDGVRRGHAVGEMRLRCVDGSRIWVRHTVLAVPTEDGGQEMVGFITDITAERAAREREEAALQAGRAQMERLLTGVPVVLFHRDCAADGTSRLLYRGGDIEVVTGWPAATVAGADNLAKYVEQPRYADLDSAWQQVVRDGVGVYDWRMRQPAGPSRWMRTHARVLHRREDGGGEVVGYILDVTAEYAAAAEAHAAREREEAALAVGRAQMERLLTGVPAVLFHRAVAPDGTSRNLYRGGDVEAVTGWPAAALNDIANLGDLGHPAPVEFDLVFWTGAHAGGFARRDWQMRQPDGSLRWMRTHGRLLSKDAQGGGEVIGYVLDVTAEYATAAEARAAREREEAALAEGRAQMQRLLTGVPVVLFHRELQADGTSRLLYRGGDVEAVMGWPAATFAGTDNLADFIEPPRLQDVSEAGKQVLRDGSGTFDWRMRQAAGPSRWMRTHARVLHRREDGGGEVVGYILDVSAEYAATEEARAAREREEAALQEGRAQMERLLTGVPVVLFHRTFEADGSTRLLYRGGDIEVVTGWPATELAGTDDLGLLRHPAPTPFNVATVASYTESSYAIRTWQMRQPDGSLRWVRTHARLLSRRPDGGGEIVGYVLDVSAEQAAAEEAQAAREREEAARQEGRAQVERLLTGLPAIIFLREVLPDGSNRLLYRGGDIAKVTGWPPELAAKDETWAQHSEVDLAANRQVMLTALAEGSVTREWRLRRPDGRWGWMRSHVIRLFRREDGSGEVAGYMLDIDDERKAAAQARAAEAALDTTLAAAPIAVYRGRIASDGDFTRSFLSRGIERLTGHPWAAVDPPGGLAALIHPKDRVRNREQQLILVRDGQLVREVRMRHVDGRWIWTRHTLVATGQDAEGHTEMLGFIVDITAEHAARSELERTLAAAPIAVFRGRARPDGGFARRYLSPGITALTGLTWEEASPVGVLRGLIDWDSFGDRAEITRRLIAEDTVSIDHRLRHADGRMLNVRTTITVLERLPGDEAEVVGFIADVTAERAAQAQAAAAGRLAALGEMGTGLAHELKQPLATISLAAQNAVHFLRKGNPEAASTRLERIIGQAGRAAEIIENLRRFARGAEKDQPVVPVALDRAVEGALSLVGGVLREAEVAIDVSTGHPPLVVLGQMVSLEQVLANLLVNATHAMQARPPGLPRRVRIAAIAVEGQVRLEVSDTGGGIPAAVLPRLFEPFVSTKEVDRGMGLGLSICHGLVKAMGGTIAARNGEEGAILTVTLPAA